MIIEYILPPKLERLIVDTIKHSCLRFREYKKQSNALFYDLYTVRRKKHELTAAVLSGFAPDRFSANDVTVRDLQYGLANNRLYQPELVTETAIIQIYSNGAKPLENKIVQEQCATYNKSVESLPRFLLIQFTASKEGILKKVEAIYPDESSRAIEKKTLYYQQTELVSAV